MVTSILERITAKQKRIKTIWILVFFYTGLLFFCSSLKHGLFQSTAWDLGIFDQALYLISQGQTPVSSFLGFHILGDHAAFVLYPISLLYVVITDVHILLLLQAFALALGAYLVFRLSILAKLTEQQGLIISLIYLLYPAIFNINLFDFHPDVIAVPALLWIVLAARCQRRVQFCVALTLVLSCKAVLSLTVAAIGLWLLLFEQRRKYGGFAIIVGIAWFIIATQLIIPGFGSDASSIARHLVRYQDLGGSFSEVIVNIFTRPTIILGRIFSQDTLDYLYVLFLPVIYVFFSRKLRYLVLLIPALPTIILNILSSDGAQRDLFHQYSLPVVPFLLLAVIAYLKSTSQFTTTKRRWAHRLILIWAFLMFINFSRLFFLIDLYQDSIGAAMEKQQAISYITTSDSVLTTNELAPHLSHRTNIQTTVADAYPNLEEFRYILLNTSQPGWRSTSEFSQELVNTLNSHEKFQLRYQQENIYLFAKK